MPGIQENIKQHFIDSVMAASQMEFLIQVVADTIVGAIYSGTIQFRPIANHINGVTYDYKNNIIIIDPIYFGLNVLKSEWYGYAIPLVKKAASKIIIPTAEDIIKLSFFNGFGKMIASIMYHGILIYNRFRPNILSANEDIRRWYLEFFYRCIYEDTMHLTFISRRVASLWVPLYLKLAYDLFEYPTWNGYRFDKSDVKKIKGTFLSHFRSVMTVIENDDSIDEQENIDAITTWFTHFIRSLFITFVNQTTRARTIDQFIIGYQIEGINKLALQLAYDRMCARHVSDKLPLVPATPSFKELFFIGEPMAQSTYLMYSDGHGAAIINWQKIAARGISFLKQANMR